MRAEEAPWPSIDDLLSLASQQAVREEWVEAHLVEPMYLRVPDAEINWATREGR
jgi:tRNA threonylcarbamoyladenosine biosynthesis protein TsaB